MTDPSPGSETSRRRRGPSLLRLFLGAATVLGWVFDAFLVLRRARHGPWRAEVAEGSMAPSLLPGDWLLLDPTGVRWPRPGSIVVIREPGTGILAIKRVVERGSTSAPGTGGDLQRSLGPRDAWLLGDAPTDSIDSRTYGPLDADALVARAWFRYGPLGRVGRIR
jgi:signal peptidase I